MTPKSAMLYRAFLANSKYHADVSTIGNNYLFFIEIVVFLLI